MYIYLNSVHKYLYVHSKTDHNRLLDSLGVCLSARIKAGASWRASQLMVAAVKLARQGQLHCLVQDFCRYCPNSWNDWIQGYCLVQDFCRYCPNSWNDWIQDDSWSANGCRRLFVFCNPISQLKGILVLNVPWDHCFYFMDWKVVMEYWKI